MDIPYRLDAEVLALILFGCLVRVPADSYMFPEGL